MEKEENKKSVEKINKNKLLLPGILVGSLVFLTLATTGVVLAYQGQNHDEMSQNFADRFKLNQGDVEKFMDEQKEERWQQRQAERKTQREEMLSQAVKDGKITEAQKNALLQKWSEMSENREQRRGEFHEWAESQGIDLDEIGPMGMGRGMGRRL